jgi:hypothetical protein
MAIGNVMQHDSTPHEHFGMPSLDGSVNVLEDSTKSLYRYGDVQHQWYAPLVQMKMSRLQVPVSTHRVVVQGIHQLAKQLSQIIQN